MKSSQHFKGNKHGNSSQHYHDSVVFGVFNPIALRTAKTSQNFGCSECSRVQVITFVLVSALKLYQVIFNN